MVLGLAQRNVGRVARTNFSEVMFPMRYRDRYVSSEILLHPCRVMTRFKYSILRDYSTCITMQARAMVDKKIYEYMASINSCLYVHYYLVLPGV